MTNVEVSIGIITYNHEKYIRQCRDSVLEQKTTFSYQVIVAEDASPDNTRSILLEYKEKYGDKLINRQTIPPCHAYHTEFIEECCRLEYAERKQKRR